MFFASHDITVTLLLLVCMRKDSTDAVFSRRPAHCKNVVTNQTLPKGNLRSIILEKIGFGQSLGHCILWTVAKEMSGLCGCIGRTVWAICESFSFL